MTVCVKMARGSYVEPELPDLTVLLGLLPAALRLTAALSLAAEGRPRVPSRLPSLPATFRRLSDRSTPDAAIVDPPCQQVAGKLDCGIEVSV